MTDTFFDPYDEVFWRSHIGGETQEASRIGALVWSLYHPEYVVDVGCGPGLMLRGLRAAAGPAHPVLLGVDSSEGHTIWSKLLPEDNVWKFVPFDLRDLCDVEHRIKLMGLIGHPDLVICTETGEHLPPEVAEGLVAFISSITDRVVWSAAIPGQQGTQHLNEQPEEYWVKLYEGFGMKRNEEETTKLREAIGPISSSPWYRRIWIARRA